MIEAVTKRFDTIDQVLAELDLIIAETISQNNLLGIFAYVYRRTTAEIKKAVEEQRFEDNPRMVAFDITFACLYIEAYYRYQADQPVGLAWKRAFDYSNRKLSVIQHVLLGMNAHINLDLGIAAAKIAEGDDIDYLKRDFILVNQILADLVDEIQEKISRVSPLMFLLDWLGRREDEKMINFNIWKARHYAWKVACTLVKIKDPQEKEEKIQFIDREVAHQAYLILIPKLPLLRFSLKLISWFEEKNTEKIISKLKKD